MKYSKQIKPVSFLKSNAARILDDLGEHGGSMIITKNGEAKVIIQDIQTYEETQETLQFLKIVALGKQQIKKGKFSPAEEVFKRLRERHEIK